MMWGGIWFQTLGPQTEKARFPYWVRVLMTTAALVVEERRWRRPDSSLLNLMILLRYAGARWLRVACNKLNCNASEMNWTALAWFSSVQFSRFLQVFRVGLHYFDQGAYFTKLVTNFRKIFVSSSDVNKLRFRKFFIRITACVFHVFLSQLICHRTLFVAFSYVFRKYFSWKWRFS